MRSSSKTLAIVMFMTKAAGAQYALNWSTLDSGGELNMTGGAYTMSATIGQLDARSIGNCQLGVRGCTPPVLQMQGGFWSVGASATVIPAATLMGAVSHKPNSSAPGGSCDLPVTQLSGVGTRSSEPRQGGITRVRLTFDVAPGSPGPNPVMLEQATCASPAHAPYSGASTYSATVVGNELVVVFTPGLENARAYKLKLNASITSILGQFIEVRGLVGDVNSDGSVNATDRSGVVAAWTGPAFSCSTDLDSSGATNATDRSIVVSAWTGGQNCAP